MSLTMMGNRFGGKESHNIEHITLEMSADTQSGQLDVCVLGRDVSQR